MAKARAQRTHVQMRAQVWRQDRRHMCTSEDNCCIPRNYESCGMRARYTFVYPRASVPCIHHPRTHAHKMPFHFFLSQRLPFQSFGTTTRYTNPYAPSSTIVVGIATKKLSCERPGLRAPSECLENALPSSQRAAYTLVLPLMMLRS